jgi:hypothetical protein
MEELEPDVDLQLISPSVELADRAAEDQGGIPLPFRRIVAGYERSVNAVGAQIGPRYRRGSSPVVALLNIDAPEKGVPSRVSADIRVLQNQTSRGHPFDGSLPVWVRGFDDDKDPTVGFGYRVIAVGKIFPPETPTWGRAFPQLEELFTEILRSLPLVIGNNTVRTFAGLRTTAFEKEDVFPLRKGAGDGQRVWELGAALDNGHVCFFVGNQNQLFRGPRSKDRIYVR